MYVFLRKDLTPAQSIIQASHACFETGLKCEPKYDATTHLVLLETKDEEQICKLESYLELHDIEFTTFFEPDDNLGKTSIATAPIESKEIRKLFRKFKMWKP